MQETKRKRRFPKKPASVRSLKSDDAGDGTLDSESRLEARIDEKRQSYFTSASRYKLLYYSVRLLVGVAAGLLPFFVTWNSGAAVFLSVLVVVGTVLDSVFTPHAKWKTFSRASDLLFLFEAKASSEYDRFAEAIDVILETESKAVSELLDVNSLVETVKKEQVPPQENGPG